MAFHATRDIFRFATQPIRLMPRLNEMRRGERLEHFPLRSFTDEDGHFSLQQSADKRSKWAKLARQGHDIAWEVGRSGGAYTGQLFPTRTKLLADDDVSASRANFRDRT